MSNILEVRDLTYRYAGVVEVLHDLTFDVPAGTIVGLVGPNGSGKSTLIKVALDLLALQSGTIRVGGDPHTSPSAKAAVSYAASNDYLPEFLTPREFYQVLGRLYGNLPDHNRAVELFTRYSMVGRYDDLIASFSHGMRKKTQLIAALVFRRRLTVIDETLNGIDLEALHLAEEDLRRLRDEGGAILLCSHDFTVLERLAQRVVFIDRGHLIEDDLTSAIISCHGSLRSLVFGHLESPGRST